MIVELWIGAWLAYSARVVGSGIPTACEKAFFCSLMLFLWPLAMAGEILDALKNP